MRVSQSFRRVGLAVLLLSGAALTQISCQSTVPNRSPLGETFPSVSGKSLEGGTAVELPAALAGAPAVLLIGYDQDAQFDADRWLYGLLQADLGVQLLELPTIKGLFPRMIAGTIDSGMRAGIPSEDWASVVTVYGAGAGKIVDFTGNEVGSNIRVLLLDAEGRTTWFHDRGFSAGKLIELQQALGR